MKRVLLLLLMVITLSVAKSQNAMLTKDGNYVSVPSNRGKAPVNTGKTYTDVEKGIIYPIYINGKGKLFIIKRSKKTGKEYRSPLKIA